MLRHIAHALGLEPFASHRGAGKPNSRKEIPNPKAAASKRDSRMKKGSWPPEGSGLPGSGGPDDLPERHRWHGEQGGDQRYFDPSLHERVAPYVE
jgi:hypothetical protein